MPEIVKIKGYHKKVRDLISRILEAALEAKDLKHFFNEIVDIGSEIIETKSCIIFLLEGLENGGILRAYSASGEMGKALEEKKAWYYVPRRKSFEKKGTGKRKVMNYLEDYYIRKYRGNKEKLKKKS